MQINIIMALLASLAYLFWLKTGILLKSLTIYKKLEIDINFKTIEFINL